MTPQERHNAICNVSGEALWGLQTALVLPATVLTVLLTQLGAARTTIGLIPAFDGLAMFLPIVGIYLFRSHKKRKGRIILFHYVAMVPCLAVMGIAVLAHGYISDRVLKAILICGWAAFMGCLGVVGAAWFDWLAHLFRREIRGTVTGMGWGFSSLAGIAGALMAGWALRGNHEVQVFGWLYLAAYGVAMLSISMFFGIRDPAAEMVEDYAPGLRDIIAAARESLSDLGFRRVLAGRCLSVAGFCIGPFIALHYLSAAGGGLADSLVVSMGAAQTAGSAISCMVFGRIGDRVGHRFGMLMGIVFQLGSLLSALLVTGQVGCFLAMLMAGCVWGTFMISYMNLVVESCPHEVRSAHLMIGNTVVGVAGLVFPIVGAQIAARAGIPTLLEVSLVVSAVALAWGLWKVKDPRDGRRQSEALSMKA